MNLRKGAKVFLNSYNKTLNRLIVAKVYTPQECIVNRGHMFQLMNRKKRK